MNDYLERVEAQLSQLTERGAHLLPESASAPPPGRPRSPHSRRRTEALAFLAAFAVAAAVVAIVVLNVHTGKPRRTAAVAAHTTTTKPTAVSPAPAAKTQASAPPPTVPAHFAPQSFTAIGELTWWLLGPGRCSSCGAILRTTDGGRTFTAIGAPDANLTTSGSPGTGYSELAFADTKNGFAYGPGLYATHDGGESWHTIALGGTVTGFAISSGEAYAVVQPSGGSGRLMESPVAQDDWTAVTAAGGVAGGLWVQGSEVIVQAASGTGPGANVQVSQDGGRTFTASPVPSPGLPCQFAAPEPPVVWAHCATGTESGVWRSSDNGAQFTTAVSTGGGLRLPNSAAFAAASASTAVVGYQQLYRTADDGVTWNPVGPSGIVQWAYLGFTDPTHGVALGYAGGVAPQNERLYYTTDAGQSYHLVPLP